MRLSSKVSSSDRCAVVPEFSGNHGARFFIERALFDGEGFRRWAAGNRRLPARKLFVTALSIGVPEAVGVLDIGSANLLFVAMKLFFVVFPGRNKRTALGQYSD